MSDQKFRWSDVICQTSLKHYNAHWSGTLCGHTTYIHLYTHLIPTSQCFGGKTVTSCNFPHKPTVCNTGTGFMSSTVTFLKHFRFGRAAATTSPASNVGEGHIYFIATTCKQTEVVPAYLCTCVRTWVRVCVYALVSVCVHVIACVC